MKLKSSAIFLLIASAVMIIIELYGVFDRFFGSGRYYYLEHPANLIVSLFQVILPLALLFLAISLMQQKNSVPSEASSNIDWVDDNNASIPSIGKWLSTFLITIIPLVGFIFLIVWANDKNNMVRKNWAVASLIWYAICCTFMILFYGMIYLTMVNRY